MTGPLAGDGVQQVLAGHAVVDVGAAQSEGERDAAAVGDQVPLGAQPAAIRRVRPGRGTPFFVARDAGQCGTRRHGGLPPFGLGEGRGSSGSMISHSESDT